MFLNGYILKYILYAYVMFYMCLRTTNVCYLYKYTVKSLACY